MGCDIVRDVCCIGVVWDEWVYGVGGEFVWIVVFVYVGEKYIVVEIDGFCVDGMVVVVGWCECEVDLVLGVVWWIVLGIGYVNLEELFLDVIWNDCDEMIVFFVCVVGFGYVVVVLIVNDEVEFGLIVEEFYV